MSFACLKVPIAVVAMPDGKLWFNSSSNPGMATAGSGDVLTGIIGGLLAKGYSPKEASLLGVYAQGFAADIKIQALSQPYLLATDIIKDSIVCGKQWKIILNDIVSVFIRPNKNLSVVCFGITLDQYL